MAASETDIANEALGRLGISPIMDLSDATKQAQFANRFYAQTRDEVLTSHPWSFAISRATLAQLTANPDFEWLYRYQLPTDCLRLLKLNGYEVGEIRETYVVEGNTVLTDAEQAEIRYIARITDVTLFPPLFIEALAIKLASKLSAPLTGRFDQPTALMQEYDRVTGPKARLVDAFEGQRKPKPAFIESWLVRSRRTGG
jgi:hypothetical protein